MSLDFPKPLVCKVDNGVWRCSVERPWGAVHQLLETFPDALAIANDEAMHNPIYSKEYSS